MIKDNLDYALILFDFDDTLAVHSSHADETGSLDSHASYEAGLINGIVTYESFGVPDKVSTNSQFVFFLALCDAYDIPTGLLSAAMGYPQMERKFKWIKDHYPGAQNIKNYCVGTPEQKIVMIEALKRVYRTDPDKILIIDDRGDLLRKLDGMGYDVATPLEVVNFVNRRRKDSDF